MLLSAHSEKFYVGDIKTNVSDYIKFRVEYNGRGSESVRVLNGSYLTFLNMYKITFRK